MPSTTPTPKPRRRPSHSLPSVPFKQHFSARNAARTAAKSSKSSTPVKSFYLPQTIIQQIVSLPSQILFALLGMLGIAHYARQIVRVRPKVAGTIALKAATPDNATDASDATDTTVADEVNVDQWITKNTPSLSASYTPSWWLPNGHLQTFFIVAGNFTKADSVDYVRTVLRIPDGGTLSLDFSPPNHEELPADTPTILVNHGLTGNANESYVRNVLAWVVKPKSEGGLGARGVVANFRGCGGTPVTSAQLYSAAASVDTNTVAHYLRATYPESPIHGVGFSLGASVLARYLGEHGADSILSSGCVLGCPWNVVELSHALEDGWFSSRVYSRALGQNLIRLFFRAYDAHPEIFEEEATNGTRAEGVLEEMTALRARGNAVRLKEVDEVITRRCGGPEGAFPLPSADAYYKYAGSHQLIHNVKVPLLGINAFDDPVVHGDALPIPEVTGGSHVHLAVTGGGGHLGWFDGPLFGTSECSEEKTRTSRWIRRPIAEFLTAAARDLPARGSVATVAGTGPAEVAELAGQEGWSWVDAPPMVPQLNAAKTRIGWKVLERGTKLEALSKFGAPAQGL